MIGNSVVTLRSSALGSAGMAPGLIHHFIDLLLLGCCGPSSMCRDRFFGMRSRFQRSSPVARCRLRA